MYNGSVTSVGGYITPRNKKPVKIGDNSMAQSKVKQPLARQKRQPNAAGNMKLKNHITGKAKAIESEYEKRFGFNRATIMKAMYGDVDANRTIGEMGRQGRTAQKFAPVVAQNLSDAIAGTNSLNDALKGLALNGASAITNIERNESQVELANTKFLNDRELLQLENQNARDKQDILHANNMDYARFKGEMDIQQATIDAQFRLLQAEIAPDIADAKAREAHREKLAEKYAADGELTNPEHLPMKQYGGQGLVSRVKEMLWGIQR